MTVRTSAGTTLKVSASTPATFDATGYNALTMTMVGEVSDLGEFGREFNLVTFNPVGSRGVVKKKGSFNQGTMTIQLGLDTDDAGQILLKSASTSDSVLRGTGITPTSTRRSISSSCCWSPSVPLRSSGCCACCSSASNRRQKP